LPAGKSHLASIAPRNPQKPLTMSVWAHDDGWTSFDVKTRGITWRFSGALYLQDFVLKLNAQT
jgi:hypothetical protein